jgi:hypothetical protein
MKLVILFLSYSFTLMSVQPAQAQSTMTPHSPFFGPTHDIVDCKSSKEERGRLEKPGVETKNEVCILHVKCKSRLKLNPKVKGPEVNDRAFCWADQNNKCPSAQYCLDDRTHFKPQYIKYVKKITPPVKRRTAPAPAKKSAR